MGLQYVVAKRIFGFDKDKNVKYVAKSVGAGELDFDKLCAKVSRILGIHRKTVDLVATGLIKIQFTRSYGFSYILYIFVLVKTKDSLCHYILKSHNF
jgi:hypothetical protein